MKVTFCKCSLVQWNSWFLDILGPNVINILIFYEFYHHHSNAPHWRFHEMFNISKVLPVRFQSDFLGPHWWSYEHIDFLLVLPSLLNRPTFQFDVPQGSSRSTKESPRRPKARNDVSRHSQGPDSPRTPQAYEILYRCYRLSSDYIQNTLYSGSRAGIIPTNTTFVWGLALG